jgi:MFS superfamily sulfate permease-like transporter
MLVGVVLIGLALLRMGFVSRFIAAGVQVGFMFGLGLTIIVGQLPDLLGVEAGDGDVFAQAGHLLSLLVSGLTVVTAVALLPLFRDLPQAALAAVVISAVIGFLDLAAMERVRRLRRDSFVIALVSLVAVLALGVLQGLIVGVVISVGVLLVGTSRPSHTLRTGPGLLVSRLNAPLLYVNAKRARDDIKAELLDAAAPVRVVLLDLSFTPDLDIQDVNVLASLHHQLAGQGVALWLGGVHAQVQDMLVRSGLADEIGRDRLYRDVEDAVADASA